MSKFQIEAWGSNPEAGNDDCWCALGEFTTRDEALAAFHEMNAESVKDPDIAWVSLVVVDAQEDRLSEICSKQIRSEEEAQRDDRLWRQEQAHQAGMAFGCAGYNDVMGY